jgi:phage related integrase
VTCDIRDLAILSLLYESGCRVQELIDLKYDDLSLNSPATISVTGKGNKTRIIPISNKVVSILNKYTAIYKISGSTEVLFTNKQAKSLTRSGISYIIKKHS